MRQIISSLVLFATLQAFAQTPKPTATPILATKTAAPTPAPAAPVSSLPATPEPTASPVAIATPTPELLPVLILPLVTPWVALDVMATIATENAVPNEERFRVRTLDVGAKFDFDPDLVALVDVGGREQNGTLALKLREGYVDARLRRLSSSLRAGQFFLGIGVLNQTPVERWPFPSAPLSHAAFFADERIYDSGIEVRVVPVERLAVTLGLTNGYWYGTAPSAGGDKPQAPTHYVRPTLNFDVGDGHLVIAGNYLSRVDFFGERMRLAGFDASFTRGDHSRPIWMTWLEAHHRFRQAPNVPLEEMIGGYLYNQTKVNERWDVGLRLDVLTVPTLTNATGGKRENLQSAAVPVFIHRLTSNSEIKTAYTYMRETRDGDTPRSAQKFELQFTARFGSLPALAAPIATGQSSF